MVNGSSCHELSLITICFVCCRVTWDILSTMSRPAIWRRSIKWPTKAWTPTSMIPAQEVGRVFKQTNKQTNKIQINCTKTQIYKAFWWNITNWIVVFERKHGKGRNASCNVWMNLQCKETTNHFGKVILTLLKVFNHLFLKFAQSFACYFRNMIYVLAKNMKKFYNCF